MTALRIKMLLRYAVFTHRPIAGRPQAPTPYGLDPPIILGGAKTARLITNAQ
jgi:hypothetical protein